MPQTPVFKTVRTEIAGLSVNELAAKFGTPSYIYDAAKIAERCADLKAFDVIRYAQKACSNIGILDFVRRQSVLVDAVSAGEIQRAIAAGYSPTNPPLPLGEGRGEGAANSTHEDTKHPHPNPLPKGEGIEAPPPMVYTADIFDEEAIQLVVEKNIHVNCGSIDMIGQLGERAPGRHITLRINPGFGHGHSQKTNTGGEQSKHGIWHTELSECLRRADAHGLGISGLHMHIGSGTDLEHLRHVCQAMEKTALETGRTVTTISAGGGLPVPYKAEQKYVDIAAYFELWNATRKRLEDAFGHKVWLEIEPGRYLVAESGYLVAQIRAVKQMGANTFYLLDAGFNNLARPILYGAYHPMSIVPKTGTGADRPIQNVVVGGPLCESGDIFTQEEGGIVCTRGLPTAEVGEYLVLEVAGAYGFVMSTNYNGKPFAAEVLIKNGKPHLIRARETFADLIRGEVIPKD